jgi:Tfp pilus assembly protein PilN
MIRINLLPQKRPKRQAGRRGAQGDPSSKHFRRDDAALRQEIARQKEQLLGFDEMQKQMADAEARKQSIDRLLRAKVVPAHVLHELGEILTSNRLPTMTEDMRKRTNSDPNKRFQQDWDPTHVWLSGYSDNNGVFKLEGGAQSESDVTQLSKRLAASVHFLDVTPAGGERVTDQASGVNYYKFTITGRVAY